jgi:hypothetical protein
VLVIENIHICKHSLLKKGCTVTKNNPQALHIYVPLEQPYGDNWVEQVLGEVVRPVYEQFKGEIEWMWITRYSGSYDHNTPPPYGDALPDRYRSNGYYRFVLFRANVSSTTNAAFQRQVIEHAEQAVCFVEPGWVDYDIVKDLGSDRFIRADADQEERATRADLIAQFINATVKVMLDMLAVDESGRWMWEPSVHEQNPNGSVFESVHHLFCNATNVPTTVLLGLHNHQLQVETFWQHGLVSISLDPVKGFILPNQDAPINSLQVPLKY